jgi:hypothetical protein
MGCFLILPCFFYLSVEKTHEPDSKEQKKTEEKNNYKGTKNMEKNIQYEKKDKPHKSR